MDISEELRIQNDAIAKVNDWLSWQQLHIRTLTVFREIAGDEIEDPANLRIFGEIQKSLMYDALLGRTRA